MEDEGQDVVCVEMRVGKNEKIMIVAYYGKQEKEKADVIEREYSQLDPQITTLRKRWYCMIKGDLPAKL